MVGPADEVQTAGVAPRHASRATRSLALAGALAALLAVFFLDVRPWYLHWGATEREERLVLPGDAIIPHASGGTTRAITIHAPIERVWPWLAQVGQDRGGFYSYDLLENLVGSEMPTDDVLRPDRQTWNLGDRLWMYPPTKAGGLGFATLRSYVPGRALAFATRAVGTPPTAAEDGSWSWVLVPLGDTATRFLARGRGVPRRSLLGVAFDRAIFEPVHFVMERRMMIGLGQLAEGGDRGRLANHVQVGLWTVTFGLLVVAAGLVMRRADWRRPFVGFVAAAVVFQMLTLAQPPAALGAILVAMLGGYLWVPRHPPRARTRSPSREPNGARATVF